MKIKSKSKIGSGRPRAERNGMTSKGKALLVFTVIAGLASIVYAYYYRTVLPDHTRAVRRWW